jgi:hypothetical protein
MIVPFFMKRSIIQSEQNNLGGNQGPSAGHDVQGLAHKALGFAAACK